MSRIRVPIVAIAGGTPIAGASMQVRNRVTAAVVPVYAAETGATTLTVGQQVSDAFGRFPGWTDSPLKLEATVTPPGGSGLGPWIEAWDAAPAGDADVKVPWLDPAAVSIAGVPPIGAMSDYAGAGDPAPDAAGGTWLLCDGRAISRTTYAALFAAIASTYGGGDGSTTFNLPDLRGRVAVGPDNMGTAAGAAGRLTANGARGNAAGEEKHTLTTPELPAHTHNVQVDTSGNQAPGSTSYLGAPNAGTGKVSGSTGSGTAHNVMQPFQIANKIIRAK